MSPLSTCSGRSEIGCPAPLLRLLGLWLLVLFAGPIAVPISVPTLFSVSVSASVSASTVFVGARESAMDAEFCVCGLEVGTDVTEPRPRPKTKTTQTKKKKKKKNTQQQSPTPKQIYFISQLDENEIPLCLRVEPAGPYHPEE